MNTKNVKTNKYLALLTFASLVGYFIPLSANAGTFDWPFSSKTNSGQASLVSFVASNGGVTFFDTGRNKNSNDMQLIQSNALIATASPVKTSKTTAPSETKSYIVTATAYSSTVDQTDDQPFITASGTHVRDGVIAANFLPFGTIIKIPELFGDKTFVVEDRMNRRYFYHVDVWFPTRQESADFGIKKVKIEVVS